MIIVGSGAIGVICTFYNSMGTEVTLNSCQTLFLLKTRHFETNGAFHEKNLGKIMTNSSVEKIDTTGAGVKHL
jgi:dihydrolipoamide dehydrogenase